MSPSKNEKWRVKAQKSLKEARKCTKENKDLIIKLYTEDKLSACELGRRFGLSDGCIRYFLRRNHIEVRPPYAPTKYQIDDNYYEKIDNQEKAYFLGWIASDGCFVERLNAIILNLQARDIEILEKFKKSLKSDAPIFVYERPKSFENKKQEMGKYCKFSFSNKKIGNDIKQYGITEAKSLTLKWPPNLPEEYIWAFCRGWFEGDGTIVTSFGKNGNYRCNLSLLGTYEFCLEFCKILKARLNISLNVHRTKDFEERGINIYRLNTSNRTEIVTILDNFYENHDGFYLGRKYEKYMQLKQYLIEHPINQKCISRPKTKVLV